MNRSEFLGMIQNNGQIGREALSELRDLVGIYPWFQCAHLLLLKGLHNTGDVKFENQLRQSALYIANREVLYYLLYPVGGEKVQPEKPVQEVRQLTEVPDNLQVVIDSGKNSEELIRMFEREAVTSSSEETAGKRMEQHPVFITTDSEIDESASVTVVYDDGEERIEETIVFIDPSISSGSSFELLELDETAVISEAPGEIPEEAPEEKPAEVLVKVPEEIPAEIPEEITGYTLATESHAAKTPDTPSPSDLIEKFIKANPRIEPPREKKDEPLVDISKPFTEEKSSFVTETLARIYVSQGYYSKAIEIYEKLSLKYPEKSSYFASQIEEIKKLIKQN